MCVIRRFLIVLAACVSLWLTLAPAAAQGDRSVRIDGDLVMRVGPAADLTADERAKEIETRLATLLNQSSLDLDLVIRPAETDPAVRTITLRSAIVQALKAAGISLPVPVTIDTVGSQRAETAPAQSVNARP